MFLTTVVLPVGCSEPVGKKAVVARVDDNELTEADLNVVRKLGADPLMPPREYINDWIVTELLYLEASRRGLADTEELKVQLESVRKRLAVAALLEKEIYSGDSAAVTDEAVAERFRSSAEDFALREDIVNASYATFNDRDVANTFRSAVLRGIPWHDAVWRMENDSTGRSHLMRTADHQYFTRSTLYPEELWKLARTLGKEEVSFVIKTAGGYSVLKLHGLKHQGEIPDLEYVRNDIRERLLIEERRSRYEQLIATLRARHAVEVHLDHADTTASASE
jgi:PPIC-type PPIASE domain